MTLPSLTLPSSLITLLGSLGLDEQTPPDAAQWQAFLAALVQQGSPSHSPKNSARTPLFVINRQGVITQWTPAAHKTLGYGAEMVGRPVNDLMIAPVEQIRLKVVLQDLELSDQESDVELILKHQSGAAYALTCRLAQQRNAAGQVQHTTFSASLVDFQGRKFVGRRKFYEMLLNTLPAPIAIFDTNLRYVFCNPTAIRNPQIREWIIGKDDVEYAAYRGFDPEMALRRQQYIRQAIAERQTIYYEETMHNPQGEQIFQLRTYTPMFSAEGALLLVIGHGLEITELKRAQHALTDLNNELERRVQIRTAELEAATQQLQHDAFHDSLTGLPNRALFIDRLEHAVSRAKASSQVQYAVLFLDTDRFKGVNDSLGHLAGDDMLRELAVRLRSVLRASDTVARLGGDEFAVLLEPLGEPELATLVAERIQQEMRRPLRLESYDISLSVSIGIVLDDSIYEDAMAVLRDADIAMYRAKAAGRAGYQVFTPEMRREIIHVNRLENELRSGLGRGELRVAYQSVVDLQKMQVRGFEALVRWHHPERGLIHPGEFVQIAEDSGLMLEIDHWVMREACRQMREWQQQYPTDPELELSINLSAKHFAMPGLAQQVAQTLADTGFDARLLNLEITEGALLAKPGAVGQNLAGLHRMGIHLHLDDFGTGYSSLSYLQTYPLDSLKIDRSFVARMLEHRGSAELVRTIVAMAKNMNLSAVAEGIESVEQLRFLQELGCEYGQGFLFSRPLEMAQAREMVASLAQRMADA